MTYTLYHINRAVEQFDERTLAVNALARAITATAGKLEGSKAERLAQARKEWRLEVTR